VGRDQANEPGRPGVGPATLIEGQGGRGAAPAAVFAQRYIVQGELARGGMGVILEARDPRLGRDLVIKVLPEEVATSPEAMTRFMHEAQIQGQLEHPSICPVHDFGVDGHGVPFFTMKRVKGRSLQQILDDPVRGPGSLRASLEVFVKICDAVAFAHARGVVHRDLKPDNVMVGEFGEVLVMDWGIAKSLRAASHVERAAPTPGRRPGTVAGAVLGTPAFMAPEQARGDAAAVDERSDVYALGACSTPS
jgi:serine/threonine protein kinase